MVKKVSFEGVGALVATFRAKTGVAAGDVVKVTAAGEVGPCAAGDPIAGVALSVEDGLAAVQLRGCAVAYCTGPVPAGWRKLAADGSGCVKVDAANGTDRLVVDADTAAETATILL